MVVLKLNIVEESQDDWKYKDDYKVLTLSILGCSNLEVVMTAHISIKGFIGAPDDTPRSGQQGNIIHPSKHQHW